MNVIIAYIFTRPRQKVEDRPRTNARGQGQGEGQIFKADAKDKF